MTTRLRRNWRRIWIELPLIVWLALVWGALWENFSAANLVFGAILSLLIIRTFRLPPVRLSGRFDVPRAISFFIWFLWQVVRGSFQVIWVALRQGPKVHNAVIEVPLRTDFTKEEYFIQNVLLSEKPECIDLKFVIGMTILGAVFTIGILLG